MMRCGRGRRSWLRVFFKWLILIMLVAALVCFRLANEIGDEFAHLSRLEIVAVIDGDTMRLKGGDKLRLANIDTPEQGEPYYEEATRHLERLVVNKRARVQLAAQTRDKYGRLLGSVFVDSMSVSESIVRHGLAYVFLFQSTDLDRPEIKRLLEAQRQAMTDKVGLWSLRHEPEPYYVARAGSFRFHRRMCPVIRKVPIDECRLFRTREEALYEGLSPCRRCRP